MLDLQVIPIWVSTCSVCGCGSLSLYPFAGADRNPISDDDDDDLEPRPPPEEAEEGRTGAFSKKEIVPLLNRCGMLLESQI